MSTVLPKLKEVMKVALDEQGLPSMPVMEVIEKEGLVLFDEADAEEVEEVKPKGPARTHRMVLVYRDDDNTKASTLRLFMREGEVMNPDGEKKIMEALDAGTHSAVKLRVTGEPTRNLVFVKD